MSHELERGGGHGPAGTWEPDSPAAARQAADRSRQRLDQDLDALGAKIRDQKRQLHEAKERLGDLMREPARQVRSNPLTAVALAAGAGLLLGKVRRRRRRKEERQLARLVAETQREQGRRRRGLLRRRARPGTARTGAAPPEAKDDGGLGAWAKQIGVKAGVAGATMLLKRRMRQAASKIARN